MKKQFDNLYRSNGFKYLLHRWYILSFVMAAFLVSCSEEKNEPIGGGGPAPEQVKGVEVIPTPGGAHLKYTLPDNANLMYIEAVVNTPEGRTMNFKASSHKDTISVIGLGSTREQEVLLYSVSKTGVKSEPLSIKINPLTPPYITVFETMALAEGLGGVNVKFDNETAADLAFFIGRVDENGEFIEEDSQYTNKVDGRLLFWGFPPEKQKFGVFIRDRWDHFSDTLYAEITPILEVMLDKTKFKGVNIQNDSKYNTSYYDRIENLWDGIWSNNYSQPHDGNGLDWRNFSVDGTDQEPGTFTIDLGQVANISRIRVNHYYPYEINAPKKYEVYALPEYYSNDIPLSMGAWYNWELLKEMENVKPSEKGGSVSEDKESWEAGDIILLNPPSEAVRYIRFKSIESWNGKVNFSAAEITVFGQPIEDI